MSKKIIQGAWILTMTEEKKELFKGDLAIDGDTIVAVGSVPSDFDPDERIEGHGMLAMPGLVNTHTHMAMSLMRNYADDLPLMTWLSEKIWPLEAKLEPLDVYEATKLSIAELIRSGCTTFNDMYFEMDQVAKAVEETGIRANLSRGLIGNDEQGHEKIEDALAFYQKWNGKAEGRIKVDMGPHAPYTCSDGYLKKVVSLVKDLGCRLHIHLCESLDEVNESKEKYGVSPIKRMENIGLFEVPVNAAHCVHLEDSDLDILEKYKVSVLHNPTSNLKLGNGVAPVAQMLKRGINVSLGTDGSSSNNNVNMFEELHLSGLIHKGATGDPTVLPAYQALQMATIFGAKALGIDDQVGTLEVGKKADIILVDIQKSHFYPHFNLVSALVYSASAQDVSTVICNGKILMQHGVIQTFDEQDVCEKVQVRTEALVNRLS